ncbi:HAD family hydrolase [Staphylospora marina]|uniref:HAD family hydrolase n=1 Tax=Staphylospora marina TaxID=2490858 RepID=UPI000F5BC829|nr:HAD family hydrolase [Staphylospora marina]
MIRAVFFDAGHTLIRSYGVSKEDLLRHACRLFAPKLAARPLAWSEGARAMELHFQQTRLQGKKASFTDNLRIGLKAAGIPDTEAKAWALSITARKLPKKLRPEPGAIWLLQRLKRAGLNVAVVSNWDGSLERALEKLRMHRWIDAVVDSGKTGVRKPDPRIFHVACRKLRIRPDEAVHVGDIYAADILGARVAGIRGVLYDPLGIMETRVSCPVIRRLPELVAVLNPLG